MSKITFRAEDELVSRLEALETSKSEAMREALRSYLDGAEREPTQSATVTTMDELVSNRLDQLLTEREPMGPPREPSIAPDITVNVSLEGLAVEDMSVSSERESSDRKTADHAASPSQLQSPTACAQCGETVDDEHVYCPNCGEKASHRLFCECGGEIQSDWGFCPSCGRRTAAADVLDTA